MTVAAKTHFHRPDVPVEVAAYSRDWKVVVVLVAAEIARVDTASTVV